MSAITIDVAEQFTPFTYGRYREDSDRSGEVFREDLLVPAMREHDHVTVDLSGSIAYGSGFLEEAFGGLVRNHYSKSELDRRLKVIHTKLPSIELEVQIHIQRADEKKGKTS